MRECGTTQKYSHTSHKFSSVAIHTRCRNRESAGSSQGWGPLDNREFPPFQAKVRIHIHIHIHVFIVTAPSVRRQNVIYKCVLSKKRAQRLLRSGWQVLPFATLNVAASYWGHLKFSVEE